MGFHKPMGPAKYGRDGVALEAVSVELEDLQPPTCERKDVPVSYLSFHDVHYEVNDKLVLKGISGYVPAGKLLAIMGPSGAGKSTLLDILASREKHGSISGRILAHFTDGSEPAKLTVPGAGNMPLGNRFQQLCGYVTQEDTFSPNLTVRETLQFAQALRKNAHAPIDGILKTLNLTKVAGTIVGSPLKRGISGGEGRRLSIAIGLLISPAILFIDEPTTNLDSYAALKVMRTIRKLCDNGYTVVCSIHQPRSNIYDMFDYLLLLDGGRNVYFGPQAGVVPYFSNELHRPCGHFHNPADIFLDLLEEDKDLDAHEGSGAPGPPVHAFPDVFARSRPHAQMTRVLMDLNATAYDDDQCLAEEEGGSAAPPTPWAHQLRVLLRRSWLDTSRNKVHVYLRMFAAIGISVVMGLLFFQTPDNWHTAWNRVNTINFAVTVFMLFSVPAISKFIEDRLILWRERSSALYSTSSYYLAVVSTETIVLGLMTILYATACYWMVGMEPDLGHFLYFAFVLFFVINISCAICQCIAAMVNTVPMAVCAYMMVVAYMLLFGGFIVRSDQLPHWMQWSLETSFYFHGTQGLLVNEFENKKYGATVQKWLGVVHQYDKGYHMEVLIIYFIVARVTAYWLLEHTNKEKR